MSIDFGFCRVKILGKNLSYAYRSDFVGQLNHTSFEKKVNLCSTDFKLSDQESCYSNFELLENKS